ncbi:MAG TPA: LacI family DNA-binding transcriptional regulator [Rubrobacter sp.]|jgi:DNA-binding LacI/PurR family transcriptional regulator|nr:LacI family DNA-binding transcriptional regulator [Rubrobacter sp.]
MVSIDAVAEMAGVSPTTVSHALSGKRKVSGEVKARVFAAMSKLDYVPSRSAQSLALGVTRTLALMVPDIGNGYFAELAKGVERAAADRGYNVILCTTGFDHARERRYLEMINSRAVDGVVYAAGVYPADSPPTDKELRGLLSGMPMVFVDEEIAGTQFTAVVSDNEAGGRLAAEHLLELGHRCALVISVAGEPVSSVLRTRGFIEAWTAAGGRYVLNDRGDFTEQSGRIIAEQHLGDLGRGDLTAVFAQNDLMALGLIDVLRSRGVRIPEDVSVVGFDDISAARYSYPALTTVRQDPFALGTRATAMIIEALERKRPVDGQHTLHPVELVRRDSTARMA